MAESLDSFKVFLMQNEGKLKKKDFPLAQATLDDFNHELSSSPNERDYIKRLLCAAFGMDMKELKARLEFGDMAKAQTYIDNYLPLIPPDGLLRTYIEYREDTESPTAFHMFSFLTVLGTILGRQTCIDQNTYKVWPNLAALLVGPSGRGKKTTAATLAMRIGREAEGEGTEEKGVLRCDPRFRQLAEKFTSEAIHNKLAKLNPATGLIYAGELTSVMGKQKYNVNLIKDITRLLDDEDYLPVETIARGPQILRNIALSFLSCTNETWLVELPQDAFKGGFMARMLCIYQPDNHKEVPIPGTPDPLLYEELMTGLVETAVCQGSAELTRPARKYFCKRYREIKRSFPEDERIVPFYERSSIHMLRIALLLSICEHREEKVVVEEQHLIWADAIVQEIVKGLPKVYAFLGLSSVGEDSNKIIMAMVKNGGRISQPELMRIMRSRITSKQLDILIHTLKASHEVQQLQGGLFDDNTIYYKLLKRPEDIG